MSVHRNPQQNEPPGQREHTEEHGSYDVTTEISMLRDILLSTPTPICVPGEIKHSINSVLEYLQSIQATIVPNTLGQANSDYNQNALLLDSEAAANYMDITVQPHTLTLATESRAPPLDPEIQRNVKINRKTTLDILYTYRTPSQVIEYPETIMKGNIGYLFAMDPDRWENPAHNFVYSQGVPRGTKKKDSSGKEIKCELLKDYSGNTVACSVEHSTCQGVKICPFVDEERHKIPHIKVSPTDLYNRMRSPEQRAQLDSPDRALFHKTLAYFTAIRREGCMMPQYELTVYSDPSEKLERNKIDQLRDQERRGHNARQTCEGRILYEVGRDGRVVIRCEHYNYFTNKDHYFDLKAGNGLLDSEYLEALFLDDKDTIKRIEEEAASLYSIGPEAQCTTISNFSTMKVACSLEHRDHLGKMINPKLIQLECKSTFRVFEPLEDHRRQCPFVLVICSGEHAHPIPIPSKTPPHIRDEIFSLLRSLSIDLSDLTPRRFLRHPSVKMFIKNKFPDMLDPMLLDIHPSLANRDHLRGYIKYIQEEKFPEGTGWEGVLDLKKNEDEHITEEDRYIRVVEEISSPSSVFGADLDEDLENEDSDIIPLRLVICMTKFNSHRLANAKYIQSDIGFKRVVGFKEFELGGLDSETRTSITYCRIYLNCQTAEAHRLIFQKIDDIVLSDTGSRLKWRHIHSQTASVDDAVGIFQIAVDQHGGQAKGFGLYLKDVSRHQPRCPDLHEPHRNIQDLTEYEHLRRIMRLCANHYIRNVKSCGVPETVRTKMKSLMCISHPSWDSTLQEIEIEGGKAGKDWVADKVRSKFAFPGICWEKSFIPKVIWQVGDETSNIIESLHEDVNREGLHCTLLSGIYKARHFDSLKEKTLKNYHETGIRPSYQRGHMSESVTRSLKRRSNAVHKLFEKEDQEIAHVNKRIRQAYDLKEVQATHFSGSSSKVVASQKKKDKAEGSYNKALEESLKHLGKGSGKVGLLLPSDRLPKL